MNAVMPHREREHSRYSASAAERWMNCPGSVRLCDGVPEHKSKYAEEGTQAHELLEVMLLDKKLGAPGALAQRRAAASQDMIDAVQIAFQYVVDLLDSIEGWGLTLEKRVEVPSEAAPGEVFGTLDISIYDPANRKRYIIDYKHGAGVPVEVIGTKQLRVYALGVTRAEPRQPVDKYELVIIQPRAFHPAGPIRSEIIDAADLVDFYDEIENAIKEVQSAEAAAHLLNGSDHGWTATYLRPDAKSCRWCLAATICPAREKQALALVGQDFADVRQVTADKLAEVGELSPDRIGQILALKDIVSDWLDKVEKRGIELAKAGVFIPGRKLVEPVGRRTYDDASTVAQKMAEATDLPITNFFEPPTPLGITAMESKIKQLTPAKSKERKEALDAFALLTTKKSSGNLTLVAEDDPRPAVNAAQSAFVGVTSIPQVQIEG